MHAATRRSRSRPNLDTLNFPNFQLLLPRRALPWSGPVAAFHRAETLEPVSIRCNGFEGTDSGGTQAGSHGQVYELRK